MILHVCFSLSLSLHGLRESLDIHPVQEGTSISRISNSQSAILRHIKPCITPLSWIAKNLASNVWYSRSGEDLKNLLHRPPLYLNNKKAATAASPRRSSNQIRFCHRNCITSLLSVSQDQNSLSFSPVSENALYPPSLYDVSCLQSQTSR